MYCKYCASPLEQGNVSKCSRCGFGIDLYDGGQSFFEDEDLYIWSQPAQVDDVSLPRTEIRSVEERNKGFVKSSKAQSKQTYHRNLKNNERPFRSSAMTVNMVIIVGITACITVLLIAVLAVLIAGNKHEENNGIKSATVNELPRLSQAAEEIDEESQNNEFINLPDKTEQEDKSDEASDVTEKKTEWDGYFDLLCGKENVTLDGKKDNRAIGKKASGFPSFVYYVSIDDFERELGLKISGNNVYAYSSGDRTVEINAEDIEEVKVVVKENGDQVKNNFKQSYFTTVGNGLHCFEVKFLMELFGYECEYSDDEFKKENPDSTGIRVYYREQK